MLHNHTFSQGEIWSLLEMLELQTTNLIGSLTFMAGFLKFGQVQRRQTIDDNGYLCEFRPSRVQTIEIVISQLIDVLDNNELDVSLRQLKRVSDTVEQLKALGSTIHESSLNELNSSIDRFITTVINEMETKTFLSIKATNAKLFSNPISAFNETIFDNFPDSTFDLEEGAKCFAVGRYTASIFHLMRAMEDGVSVLAKSLGVKVIDKNGEQISWGKLTPRIGDKIKEMDKGPKRDEWEKGNALLHSVNRAWRTKACHPKTTYTEEEAKDALTSVKAFLKFMAELSQA